MYLRRETVDSFERLARGMTEDVRSEDFLTSAPSPPFEYDDRCLLIWERCIPEL